MPSRSWRMRLRWRRASAPIGRATCRSSGGPSSSGCSAGRGEEDSLCILIALEDALDQYLMRQPAYFFGRPVEHATLDPENPYILAAHLRCASSEMPVGGEDEEVFGPRMWEVAGALEGVGELVRRRARWYPRARAYPAAEVD